MSTYGTFNKICEPDVARVYALTDLLPLGKLTQKRNVAGRPLFIGWKTLSGAAPSPDSSGSSGSPSASASPSSSIEPLSVSESPGGESSGESSGESFGSISSGVPGNGLYAYPARAVERVETTEEEAELEMEWS